MLDLGTVSALPARATLGCNRTVSIFDIMPLYTNFAIMCFPYVRRYRKKIRIMVNITGTSDMYSKLAEIRKRNSGEALLNMIAAVLAHW